MLKFLDEFEGHPNYYLRQTIDVKTDLCDKTLKPWTYFLMKYKPNMLTLPMHAQYDSFGEHGLRYIERCDRQGLNAHHGHTEKSEVTL